MNQVILALVLLVSILMTACGKGSDAGGSTPAGKSSFSLWTESNGSTVNLAGYTLGVPNVITLPSGCTYAEIAEGTESTFRTRAYDLPDDPALGCNTVIPPMVQIWTNDGTTLSMCFEDSATYGGCHTYH